MTADRRYVKAWMGDLSQRNAAEALGVSQPFLNKWLKGSRSIGGATCLRWAKLIAPLSRKLSEESTRRNREHVRVLHSLLAHSGSVDAEAA